jgi:hypothetical protein
MEPSNRSVTPTRKHARRAAAGLLAATAVLLAAASHFATPAPETVTDTAAGWGAEALRPAAQVAFDLVPVPVANACGIGASSCFKCHNGTRAAAPKADKTATPWHPQHKTVNDSCVGCHQGNARIIKKEVAHTGLVKDPRATPEACGRCHKSGNTADLVKSYQVASGRK